MNRLPPIIRPKYRDADMIAALIADAFQPLAPITWLVPDPDRRQEILSANVRIFVEHAFFFGEIDLMQDHSAVAVWFHRAQPAPPPVDYERRLADACHPYTDRFQLLDKLFDTHHPTEPHHHLAFLAVRRDKQCTGRGTALSNIITPSSTRSAFPPTSKPAAAAVGTCTHGTGTYDESGSICPTAAPSIRCGESPIRRLRIPSR